MKLFIPLICYNHMCFAEYMVSMLKLISFIKNNQIDVSFFPIFADPSIGRARNGAVAHFLKDENATHLLFIDSDIIFEPTDILKLIQSDKEVISGSYPKKYIVWDRIKENPNAEKVDFTSGGEIDVEDDGHLIVEYTPPGFLLVKRELILEIIEKYPEVKYINQMEDYIKGEPHYDLFRVGINEDGSFDSGNRRFCSLVHKLNKKIYLHPNVNVSHIGWHEYKGNFLNNLIKT
jgi:hypothetical protein